MAVAGDGEQERKDPAEGDAADMEELGCRLLDAGDRAEAQRWLRRAATGGRAHAAHLLGLLLEEDGRTAEAQRWQRQAADAGVRPPAGARS